MWFGSRKPRRLELSQLIDEDMVGLLEPGIEVEGKLTISSGMVRLNTHVKGEISSEGTIIIANQGEIEGEIRTKLISVAGKVKGAIRASERLEIKQDGVVLGDIHTPSLVIDPGGYFDGTCHMPAPEPQQQTTHDVDKDQT
jgi:cytoskeletal protein CcmA (bactofilin family)